MLETQATVTNCVPELQEFPISAFERFFRALAFPMRHWQLRVYSYCFSPLDFKRSSQRVSFLSDSAEPICGLID
jgi:hypothetical protein